MSQEGQRTTGKLRAFTIIELVTVVATIAVLSALLLPALAKSQSQSHTTIDIANVRRILQAVHLYAADNTDFCPHPTWGSVPAGPTGWLYASGMPSAVATTDAQALTLVSNQMRYFRRGQLAPFVNDDQTLFDCPTDVAMRRSGASRIRYLQRSVKLSSYGFCGAISGFGTPKEAPNASAGGTYKLSAFRPSSFLLSEPDELSPFNFNDAGINQENASEGVSLRHTLSAGSVGPIGPNGRALLGRFGGEASFIKVRTWNTLRNTPAENDLRCGPGYR